MPTSDRQFETFKKLKDVLGRSLIRSGLYEQCGLGAGWDRLQQEAAGSGMFIIQSSSGHTCALVIDHPTFGSFGIDPASGSSFRLPTKDSAALRAVLLKCGVGTVRVAARVWARARNNDRAGAGSPWSWQGRRQTPPPPPPALGKRKCE